MCLLVHVSKWASGYVHTYVHVYTQEELHLPVQFAGAGDAHHKAFSRSFQAVKSATFTSHTSL